MKEEKFYPSSGESEDHDDEDDEKSERSQPYVMDSDHRLLLRSAKPLLQSRNASVRLLRICSHDTSTI